VGLVERERGREREEANGGARPLCGLCVTGQRVGVMGLAR
jgi:hypothetical protein